MKPVFQTKFSLFYSDGKRLNYGNCLVACFASILEVPIDEVPNLYVFYGLDKSDDKDITQHFWFTVMNKWLNLKHNKALKYYNLSDSTDQKYIIMRGLSMRKKPHCCVYQNVDGKFTPYFDPHQTSEFLSEEHYYYSVEDLM
jgi:hypothetical protein